MRYRTLGKDLSVSAVGFGCMGISHAYGKPLDRQEGIRLIRQAVEMGYTFFDTAEVYGTDENPHANEELVGEALRPYRNQVVIATKFGISFDKSAQEVNHPVIPNSRPEIIRASVEGSLKRLGTDRIDLYYQHRTDPNIPIEEVAGVMLELMQEGKITYWGLSEASEEVIRRAHKVCPVTAIQNRYSMMVRWHEELFSVLEELGIGFVAFSPLANGLLSARYHTDSVFDSVYDYRSVMPQFQAEALKKNENLLALLENMAQEKEVTPAQISLAWMIGKKPYIVPIPGTRNPQRMKENLKAGDVLLSEEEIKKLDAALNEMELSEVFGGSRVETRKEEEK
ncbi:MAG: aldo/keto reductase [Lachnospiraceae bacterium]|nr:aldo/keto reductase [Lachnospiraceae bacterium]